MPIVAGVLIRVASDTLRWLVLVFCSTRSIKAENLFLRRQLSLYAHPTSAWTLQQLREAIGLEARYKYLLHDRDSIFAEHLDESIERLGIRVLKSPPRCPMADAICERVIGSIRRKCLDWLIPLSESHLRSFLKWWIPHYNTGRPHMALGPGVPDPPPSYLDYALPGSRHCRGESYAVHANPILGGLHHEYFLAHACA